EVSKREATGSCATEAPVHLRGCRCNEHPHADTILVTCALSGRREASRSRFARREFDEQNQYVIVRGAGGRGQDGNAKIGNGSLTLFPREYSNSLDHHDCLACGAWRQRSQQDLRPESIQSCRARSISTTPERSCTRSRTI